MKNKNLPLEFCNSKHSNSFLDTLDCESIDHSTRLSQQLLAHYKHKSARLEKEYDDLLKIVEKARSVCDLSYKLQSDLHLRNEEIAKLQEVIDDLQVHIYQVKEENIQLTTENDQLKIQDYENKKKINMLLMLNGTHEKKYFHFFKANMQNELVESKLPPKLQKIKDEKLKQLKKLINSEDLVHTNTNSEGEQSHFDPQVLLLNNQLLASEFEQHIQVSREHIDLLLKEKILSNEERKVERQRLQKELDFLSSKIKECQNTLCETTEKLINTKKNYEKDKTSWIEEKDRYLKAINRLKERLGEDFSEIWDSLGSSYTLKYDESEKMKKKILEKESLAAAYQEQVLLLEAEVIRLRERAEACQKVFKEKTEKMTGQVAYLKNKYKDLDRRRHLEAEGFRTDIRMLRERLKELGKKLTKASTGLQSHEHQQLLIRAKSTLNHAKLLEKELTQMKSKIYALECSNTE